MRCVWLGLFVTGLVWGADIKPVRRPKPVPSPIASPVPTSAVPEKTNSDDDFMGRRRSWFSVDAGVFIHDVFRGRREPPGGATSATGYQTGSPYSIPIGVEAGWFLSESFLFSPQLLYTPFGQMSYGDDTLVRHWMASLRLGWQLGQKPIQVFLGPGIWLEQIKGPGQVIAVSNGFSSSNFATPGKTVTTRQAYLMTGVTYSMSRVHLDFQAFGPGLLTSRRSLILMVGLGYDFM